VGSHNCKHVTEDIVWGVTIVSMLLRRLRDGHATFLKIQTECFEEPSFKHLEVVISTFYKELYKGCNKIVFV
jgi:hypothetical protein